MLGEHIIHTTTTTVSYRATLIYVLSCECISSPHTDQLSIIVVTHIHHTCCAWRCAASGSLAPAPPADHPAGKAPGGSSPTGSICRCSLADRACCPTLPGPTNILSVNTSAATNEREGRSGPPEIMERELSLYLQRVVALLPARAQNGGHLVLEAFLIYKIES